MMGREGKSEAQSYDDFKTNFGTPPSIVAELARLVEENTDHYERYPNTKGYHFLWALARLKVYEKEANLTSLVATAFRGAPSGRTYRDVTWPLISSIASLKNEVVSVTLIGIANAANSITLI